MTDPYRMQLDVQLHNDAMKIKSRELLLITKQTTLAEKQTQLLKKTNTMYYLLVFLTFMSVITISMQTLMNSLTWELHSRLKFWLFYLTIIIMIIAILGIILIIYTQSSKYQIRKIKKRLKK